MRLLATICGLGAVLVAQQPTPSERFARGVAEYRAARWEAAFTEFSAAADALGAAAPLELRYDLALAALRLQRPADAEAAVRPLLAAEDATVRARAEFVAGLAACQRSERAVAAARLADAEPLAWQTALRAIETAHAAFGRAADAAPGWPEALRNAERAWRTRAELQRLAAEDAARRAGTRREEEPPPAAPTPVPEPPQEVEPELVAVPLPPAEVERLLARVRQQERDKQRARAAAQRDRGRAGDRDW